MVTFKNRICKTMYQFVVCLLLVKNVKPSKTPNDLGNKTFSRDIESDFFLQVDLVFRPQARWSFVTPASTFFGQKAAVKLYCFAPF